LYIPYQTEKGAVRLTADEAEMVMAKETIKVKKNAQSLADRRKKTQIVMLRMLIMAAIDLIGICTVLSIHKSAVRELAFVSSWLTPLAIVFGVLSAAAAAYLAVVLVKKIDPSRHPVTPAMILCVALFGLIACLVYKRVMLAYLVIASVIATVLFLVYCLYMHIFYR